MFTYKQGRWEIRIDPQKGWPALSGFPKYPQIIQKSHT